MDCHTCHLLTIHLKDVGLIQLFIAVGMTGVIAHVNSCYLGDVEGIVFSKILHVRKDRKGALVLSTNIVTTTGRENAAPWLWYHRSLGTQLSFRTASLKVQRSTCREKRSGNFRVRQSNSSENRNFCAGR